MNQRPIYATRLTPARQPNTTWQICRRCGIDYHPHKNHPTHCRDCRGYLKKGGPTSGTHPNNQA